MSYLFPANSMVLTLGSLFLCMYAFPSFLIGLTCKFLMLLYITLSLVGWFLSPRPPKNKKSTLFQPRSLYTSYAVVTGASTGIGREMAKFLARDGFNLFLVTEPSEEEITNLNQLKSELQHKHDRLSVLSEFIDLSSETGSAELINKIIQNGIEGKIDIFMNNAGRTSKSYFTETDLAEYETMMNLNVKTYTKLSYYALRQFLERGRGRLLNVGSLAGLVPGPRASVYSATNAYINSLTTCLQYECEKLLYQKRKLNPETLCDVGITLAAFGAVKETEFGIRGHSSDILQFKNPMGIISARRAAYEAINGLMLNQPVVMPGMANRFVASVFQVLPDHVRNLLNDYFWGNEDDLKEFLDDSFSRIKPFLDTSKSIANKVQQSSYTQRLLHSEKLVNMKTKYNDSMSSFSAKVRDIPNSMPEKLKSVPQGIKNMNVRMKGKIRQSPLYSKFFTTREEYESEEEESDLPRPVRHSIEQAETERIIANKGPVIHTDPAVRNIYAKPDLIETEIIDNNLPGITSAERRFGVEEEGLIHKGRLHPTNELDKSKGVFELHESSAAPPASVFDAAKRNQLNLSSETVAPVAQNHVIQPAKAMDAQPSGEFLRQTDTNLTK